MIQGWHGQDEWLQHAKSVWMLTWSDYLTTVVRQTWKKKKWILPLIILAVCVIYKYYEWKNWSLHSLYYMTSHAGPPSCRQSKLRDTQMEEWEEVLPSPPMLSDSLSSRTNLTSSGVLSLDVKLYQRNITGLTLVESRALLHFLQGRTVFCED